MSSRKFVYTDEMVARMHEKCPHGVTEEDVVDLMAEFDVPRRSLTAKMRKEGFDVPKKIKVPTFTVEETATLEEFMDAHAGQYTAKELAVNFMDGKFTERALTGKLLSMDKLGPNWVKPTEKQVVPKTFTEDQEATIREMVEDSKFIEEIAEAVGKSVQSVRGKLLSMGLKAPQRDKKASKKDAYEGIEELAETMTVAELMAHYDKTERGVKTVLARRKLTCKDYPSKEDKSS